MLFYMLPGVRYFELSIFYCKQKTVGDSQYSFYRYSEYCYLSALNNTKNLK